MIRIGLNEKQKQEEIRRYVESHKKFEHIDKYDLIEYLDIVVNMEQTIYLQNRLINQMKNRYATLGIVQMFQNAKELPQNNITI